MKKISTLMTMIAMAVLSFSFVSCDEDAEIGYTLEGTWKGNMYVSSTYSGRTYDATYSEIDFTSGIWVDYYSNAPYDYIANHITWTVNNGTIYVHFVEENTDIRIFDYSLSDYYFSGSIYSGNQTVDFRLTHTSSPNWSGYYYYGYDDWYNSWDSGYYARGYNDAMSRSVKPQVEAPKRVFRTK